MFSQQASRRSASRTMSTTYLFLLLECAHYSHRLTDCAVGACCVHSRDLASVVDHPVVQAQQGRILASLWLVVQAMPVHPSLSWTASLGKWGGGDLKRGHEQPSHLGSVWNSSVHQTCVFGLWGKAVEPRENPQEPRELKHLPVRSHHAAPPPL